MASTAIGAIVLAAGQGTRMKSARHKVLHTIAGKPMVRHLLDSAAELGIDRQVIVVGAAREQVEAELAGATFALQDPPLGTGHAVMATEAAMEGFEGDVLILYADTPLVTAGTMRAMLEALHTEDGGGKRPSVVVLGFRPRDPAHYGRLVVGAGGDLEAIVEFKEASEAERAIDLCNSGVMAVDGGVLFNLLGEVTDDNAKGEYYLTDIVEIARARGLRAVAVEASEEEVMGVNSRSELAEAGAVFQKRRRAEAMENGATLEDPDSVWFSHDTVLGKDVTIGPNVYFGPGVTIADGATILPFCHLEGAIVKEGAKVGPFARLRPGTVIGAGAKVGNFVETKKADIEDGAKVSHLSYIGDARVGRGANIGAGTITCNYDGFNKHFTDIGEGAFIGSNTALVAPVKVGAGALVGAGSVIAKDVAKDALVVTRAEHREKAEGAARFRERAAAAKEAAKKASK